MCVCIETFSVMIYGNNDYAFIYQTGFIIIFGYLPVGLRLTGVIYWSQTVPLNKKCHTVPSLQAMSSYSKQIISKQN